MSSQRLLEQLGYSPDDRQIVVEGMRREGDRTRVKQVEVLQRRQGLLQAISCPDNCASNLFFIVCHCTPPIYRSLGELLSTGRGLTLPVSCCTRELWHAEIEGTADCSRSTVSAGHLCSQVPQADDPAQSVKMMASGAYAIKAVSSVASRMQVNNPFPEH